MAKLFRTAIVASLVVSVSAGIGSGAAYGIIRMFRKPCGCEGDRKADAPPLIRKEAK